MDSLLQKKKKRKKVRECMGVLKKKFTRFTDFFPFFLKLIDPFNATNNFSSFLSPSPKKEKKKQLEIEILAQFNRIKTRSRYDNRRRGLSWVLFYIPYYSETKSSQSRNLFFLYSFFCHKVQ